VEGWRNLDGGIDALKVGLDEWMDSGADGGMDGMKFGWRD